MNKDNLEIRLKEIETAISNTNSQINQLMANLNMLEGGKQELIYWINQKSE